MVACVARNGCLGARAARTDDLELGAIAVSSIGEALMLEVKFSVSSAFEVDL